MRKIIKGSKQVFVIQLSRKEDGVLKVYDLTGNVEITVCFKSGSTVVAVNKVAAPVNVIVVGADADGKIQATLETTNTDALNVGTGSIEVVVDKGSGDVDKFQIANAFQVVASDCP